jgi:CheY-like chemotaxis protein
MKRILVVEDQELNRELLVQLLGESYDVRTACDGQEALDAVDKFNPDLILLDLSLPVLDGWSVARRLKSQPSTRRIPIIALTAHAMAGDRDQALKAGCDEYLTKPFREDQLFDLLQSILESRAST